MSKHREKDCCLLCMRTSSSCALWKNSLASIIQEHPVKMIAPNPDRCSCELRDRLRYKMFAKTVYICKVMQSEPM
eukprot:2002248-Amphidinium_carterae.1